jgi:hypothetical protein
LLLDLPSIELAPRAVGIGAVVLAVESSAVDPRGLCRANYESCRDREQQHEESDAGDGPWRPRDRPRAPASS